MNSVHLSGNLTKDPIISTTKTGKKVAKFTLAVNAGKDKPANFINVTAWEGSAKYAEVGAQKGTAMIVEGRLETGKYDKDGVTHYTTDVTAQNLTITSRGRERAEAAE